MPRAIAALAIAGLATTAGAMPIIHISADITAPSISSTITWTVSVTGLALQTVGGVVLGGDYVQGYDFSLVANNPGVGTASPFIPFAGSVNPTNGTVAGAALSAVSGGQSSILGGVQYGDIVLGTFTTHFSAFGGLSYALADGGVLAETNTLQIKNYDFFATPGEPNGDFGPDVWNGVPRVVSDVVTIPTPGVLGVLAWSPVLVRRRRRQSASCPAVACALYNTSALPFLSFVRAGSAVSSRG